MLITGKSSMFTTKLLADLSESYDGKVKIEKAEEYTWQTFVS
jgi:hypothetical protein